MLWMCVSSFCVCLVSELFIAPLVDDANFADEEEQESDSGASSKENRQQAGNTQSSQPQPTAHARLSAGAAQSKRLSSKASSAKTHRSNRLSGTSGISQVQDAEHGSSALESTHSAGQESVLGPASPQARLTPDSPAAASATRDSDAHSVGCESTGLQPSVLAEPASQEVPAPGPLPAAVTPLKASHAKAAGDRHCCLLCLHNHTWRSYCAFSIAFPAV